MEIEDRYYPTIQFEFESGKIGDNYRDMLNIFVVEHSGGYNNITYTIYFED